MAAEATRQPPGGIDENKVDTVKKLARLITVSIRLIIDGSEANPSEVSAEVIRISR